MTGKGPLMSISQFSIKKPVFAWMLMMSLLVFGYISFSRMGISQLPDVDFPVVNIQITWAGASPNVMETAVADIVEDAVMSIDGIQLVTSTSQEGSTQITIQFNLDQDINAALLQVQTKLTQAQKNLPQTIDPPVITKTNPNDQPIMWLAVFGKEGSKTSLRDLSLFVRNRLKNILTTVAGVGDVNLGGYVDPQMRIWLNPRELDKWSISATDVINAVASEHELSPSGYQDKGGKETLVRVASEFTDAESCEKLFIPARQAGPNYAKIRIGDVAKCVEGTDEIRRLSRYRGRGPAMGLGIIKQHGTNAVAIGDAVKKKVKELQPSFPRDLGLEVVTDTTVFIRDSVHELLQTLGLAVLLTSIVCFIFLGNLSSAFNVIVAIPVSLVGSFIFLNFLGFTLNSFTLMALSLSIGIVVDDAIMVLENIQRHFELGKNRILASLEGAKEITGAATAASVAVLAIFIPVIFMQGIVGKFFFEFGVSLSVAVMISLLEALTLAPMRTSRFMMAKRENRFSALIDKGMNGLANRYRSVLGLMLKRPVLVMVITMILFISSLGVVPFLRKEFLPPQDQSRFLMTIYTPMGSSLQFTDNVFKRIENYLAKRPEVDRYYIAVGGFGGGLVNQGISFVTMKAPGERPVAPPFKKAPSQQEFMQFLRGELKKIQGVERAALLDLSLTGFSAQRGYPIEFVLQGPDWNKLVELSGKLRKEINQTGLMADVDSDYNPNMPELLINPNREMASNTGVPVRVIADTIAAAVGGKKLLPNKYTDSSGHRSDIQIKLTPEENQELSDIKALWVPNMYGQMVPLKDVIDVKKSTDLLTITRYNRERGISIFGNFKPGQSQSEVMEQIVKLGQKILPPGYILKPSGSSQAFADSFKNLLFALILGIFVSYVVLATQFNSFLHPAIILLALPFSVTGALLAMFVTSTSLNIYSLIGVLLLMGIVKKNSILLVEFTNHQRSLGLGVEESLLKACPIRLRPILMTSIATMAGAVPGALALGPGSELIKPMALSVLGGVLFSTLLTLFVVPCAYKLFAPLEKHKHEEDLKSAIAAFSAAHV
jgi:HAE1 family hydrophobic/amphiphilic exporter-1